MTTRDRRGSTLLELAVTLAILGVAGLVAVLAIRPAPVAPDDVTAQVADARRRALRDRVPVSIDVVIAGVPHALTALPDGGVVADSALHIDRFTGARKHDP